MPIRKLDIFKWLKEGVKNKAYEATITQEFTFVND
jgi:hypothetical protein